jgi:hypothetical protein
MKHLLLTTVLAMSFIATDYSIAERLVHEPEVFSKGKHGIEIIVVYDGKETETLIQSFTQNIRSNKF